MKGWVVCAVNLSSFKVRRVWSAQPEAVPPGSREGAIVPQNCACAVDMELEGLKSKTCGLKPLHHFLLPSIGNVRVKSFPRIKSQLPHLRPSSPCPSPTAPHVKSHPRMHLAAHARLGDLLGKTSPPVPLGLQNNPKAGPKQGLTARTCQRLSRCPTGSVCGCLRNSAGQRPAFEPLKLRF